MCLSKRVLSDFTITKMPAYYPMELIMAVASFIEQAPGPNVIKILTVVI
jgi:hypothetical protein